MAKARILCVWRTGIASSMVMHDGVGKICKKYGVNCEIIPCKPLEVSSKVEALKPSMIVSMIPLSCKNAVPVISGIPLLRGVGIESVEENIIAALKKDYRYSCS